MPVASRLSASTAFTSLALAHGLISAGRALDPLVKHVGTAVSSPSFWLVVGLKCDPVAIAQPMANRSRTWTCFRVHIIAHGPIGPV